MIEILLPGAALALGLAGFSWAKAIAKSRDETFRDAEGDAVPCESAEQNTSSQAILPQMSGSVPSLPSAATDPVGRQYPSFSFEGQKPSPARKARLEALELRRQGLKKRYKLVRGETPGKYSVEVTVQELPRMVLGSNRNSFMKLKAMGITPVGISREDIPKELPINPNRLLGDEYKASFKPLN